MTITIGRFSTTADLFDLVVDGDRISFGMDLVGSSVDEMKAFRQQLNGLVDNDDEEVVPFTWSEDSTFDGFYRPVSVQVGSTEVMLSTGQVAGGVRVVLERVTGYANPWFEVTTSSVVRANGHGVTAPVTPMVTYASSVNPEVDLGPTLSTYVGGNIYTTSTGASLYANTYTAPVTQSAYRFIWTAANAYVGACLIEVKYGSSWYAVAGKEIPRSAVWRISNGLVRLTSADGATSGTFEVWDNAAGAWESRNVLHYYGGSGLGIGLYNGSNAPSVAIDRNSPEAVAVRCTISSRTHTYVMQRGNFWAQVAWAGAASSYTLADGFGFNTPHSAACTAFTGGCHATANDANGNRMVFGTAAANTNDLVNGFARYTTAAQRGSAWLGVVLGGGGGTAAAAAVMRDEFIGAVSWRQRVVSR